MRKAEYRSSLRACILAAGLILLLPASAPLAADDGPGDSLARDVEAIIAVRDTLARQLAVRQAKDAQVAAPADLHLRFDHGADGDDFVATLRRRGGAFLAAHASVPYWRQETQKEKFSFLHRNGVQSTRRDKFLYPIDTAKLTLADDRLTGQATVHFHLDALRDQRMPPGGRHLFTVAGRWSLLDKWRILGHTTPRSQTFAINARRASEAHLFEVELPEGIDGKHATVTFALPHKPWRRAIVSAPTFNASVHEADVSGLRYTEGELAGELKVRYVPDPWYPRKVHDVTYTIEASVVGGRLTGTANAAVTGQEDIRITGQSKGRRERQGPDAWKTRVAGRVGELIEGRFHCDGAMGPRQGRVQGALYEPAPAPANDLPAPPDASAGPGVLATAAHAAYQEVRALQMALDHYPYPYDEALAHTALPAPQWEAAKRAAIASHVAKLRRLAQRAAKARDGADDAPLVRGRGHPGDERFGPYYEGKPLPYDDDGAHLLVAGDGDRIGGQWRHVQHWRVLGPFPQSFGESHETPLLPPLVPAFQAGYEVDIERLGRDFPAPEDGLLRWRAITASEGRLHPRGWSAQRGKPSNTPGRADTFWFAAARVRSEEARAVWLAIDANDHGKLWINGQLVWVDEEREWGRRELRPAVLKVSLEKGVNDLLVRCRDDRGGSHIAMHLCTVGEPVDTPAPRTPQIEGERYYPDADPPLAFDLDEGINVLWRSRVGPAASGVVGGVSSGGMSIATYASQPPIVSAGGRVFVNVEPHTLVCLDAATGRELWRRESNILEMLDAADFEAWNKLAADDAQGRLALLRKHEKTLGRIRGFGRFSQIVPVTDGKHVWVAYETGVAACYDLEGTRKWLVRTHLTDAWMLRAGRRLVFEGSPDAAWSAPEGVRRGDFDGKRPKRHVRLALDPETGQSAWLTTPRDRFGGRPFAMALSTGRGESERRHVVISRNGEVFDAATGEVLIASLDVGDWDWNGVCVAGDTLYSSHVLGQAAMRLWLRDDGRAGHRRLWQGERFAAYTAGGPGGTAAAGDRVMAYRLVPEHAKHSPASCLALDFFDADTGRDLGRLNPATRGGNVRMPPVVAGDYVFLGDGRGGPHSGGAPHERQIHVVHLGDTPIPVAVNETPHLVGTPVFDGRRMLLRFPEEVVCIAVTDAVGKRYQAEHMGRTVLSHMYGEPRVADLPEIAAIASDESGALPSGVPVVALEPGESIVGLLAAGPYPVHALGDAPAIGGDAAALPHVGGTLTIAGARAKWKPLDPGLVTSDTAFRNDGQLDDWQQRRTVRRIDLSQLAEGAEAGGVSYLFTVLGNHEDRVVTWPFADEGMQLWLSGQRVHPGRPVLLKAGLHPMLLRVLPAAFTRQTPQPPVDVSRALAGGAVTKLNWPTTWRVFGPVPEAAEHPSREQLASPPDSLELSGQAFRPADIQADSRTIGLMKLLDQGAGVPARPPANRVAYAFARLDVPADGHLLINSAADWRMTWYVDGRPVYNTMDAGNGGNPVEVTTHTFAAPVTKGAHTLAVAVKPGSKGWSFTAFGALATGDPTKLGADYAAPRGVRRGAKEHRVSLELRELDNPRKVRQQWLKQIRAQRDLLERIANALPDHPAGKKARAYLAADSRK